MLVRILGNEKNNGTVTYYSLVVENKISGLTRDGTAETVWRDQILRHERGQGQNYFVFPCSADHEKDWQPYTRFDAQSVERDALHTYIMHTRIQ